MEIICSGDCKFERKIWNNNAKTVPVSVFSEKKSQPVFPFVFGHFSKIEIPLKCEQKYLRLSVSVSFCKLVPDVGTVIHFHKSDAFE